MSYNVKKNWLAVFYLMKSRPVIMLPFIIVAFLEALSLEVIYFLPRKPLLLVAGPVIRKFFGDIFLHYPANFVILPKLAFYAQIVIFIFLSGFLWAISINTYKNLSSGLPIKAGALINNAAGRYFSFLTFGLFMAVAIFLVNHLDNIIFMKCMRLAMGHIPAMMVTLAPVALAVFSFFSIILLQVFTVLVVPIIVIQRKSFFKALSSGVYLSVTNFPAVFGLIFLPFLIYLPIVLLRSIIPALAARTFPEIAVLITAMNSVVAIFVDCFVTICAAQFLLDKIESKT